MTEDISARLGDDGVLRISIDGEYVIESIDETLYGQPGGEIGDDENWTHIEIRLRDVVPDDLDREGDSDD